VNALCEELRLRKEELNGIVETIYLGGGTPSLLTAEELRQILDTIYSHYTLSQNPEITLEANPDDLVENNSNHEVDPGYNKLIAFKELGVNRLSIGVQSFFEKDLKFMNRAHDNIEALDCIEEAKKHFENISIDLIYGIPEMTNKRWTKNVKTAIDLGVPHLSCYALTVEPNTALKKFIDSGKVPPVDENAAREHYEILLDITSEAGYLNYEFSNFGKPGFQSKNNTAYWEGKPYLGIGPSAHSYDGESRSWNVANNSRYIKSIAAGELPSEKEILTLKDKYNEYIMTALRTEKGVSLRNVEEEFGLKFLEYLMDQAFKPLRNGDLIMEDKILRIARKSRFLGDGIASDLFMV
jgi:oxygen-independent coproporphyrinogen-3 oxidase